MRDFANDINLWSLTNKAKSLSKNIDVNILPNRQLSLKTQHFIKDDRFLDVLINLDNVDFFVHNMNTISIYTCDYIFHQIPKDIAKILISDLQFYPLEKGIYINPLNIINIDTEDMTTIDMAGFAINVQNKQILNRLNEDKHQLTQFSTSKTNPTSKTITNLFNNSLWFSDDNIDDYSKRLCISIADTTNQTLQLSFNYKGKASETELLRINHYTQTIDPQKLISLIEQESITQHIIQKTKLPKHHQNKL